MPQDALQQGGNVLGGVGVQIPAPRNAAHQGTPTISGVMPVYNAASDPTINDGVNLGIYPGTRWINSATKNLWENIDNTVGAAIWRFVPMSWQSGVPASVGAVTTEAALATITLAAGVMGTNGCLDGDATWVNNSTADDKTMRVRLGGIAGTEFRSIVTTNTLGFRDFFRIHNNGAANAQNGGTVLGFQAGGTGLLGAAVVTASINTAVATTLVLSGQKETAGDTLTLSSYKITLTRPDIGPT